MRTASDLATVTQWGVLQTVSGMCEGLQIHLPTFLGIIAPAPCGSKHVSINLQSSVSHRALLALPKVSIQQGVPQTVSNMSKVLWTRFLPSPSVTAGASSSLSSFHLQALNDVISASCLRAVFYHISVDLKKWRAASIRLSFSLGRGRRTFINPPWPIICQVPIRVQCGSVESSNGPHVPSSFLLK